MRSIACLALILFSAAGFGASASARAPLYDPVTLNIGLACQWQQKCIKTQTRSMKRALGYVKKYRPPNWRIQLCNRNASRRSGRVDWVGFNNCVRNEALRPPPPPPPQPQRRKARRG